MPRRHYVRSHYRQGHLVNGHMRGGGNPVSDMAGCFVYLLIAILYVVSNHPRFLFSVVFILIIYFLSRYIFKIKYQRKIMGSQTRSPLIVVQEKKSNSLNSVLSLSASNAQSLARPVQTTATHEIVYWTFVFNNRKFKFPNTASRLRVGRNPDNELVLNDPSISGYHALIEVKGDALEVIDFGSTNGTTVNGSRLNANQPMQVRSGDYLQFGLRVAQVRKS
jgi:FHA domain